MNFINGIEENNNNIFSTTVKNQEVTIDSIKKTILEHVIGRFIGGDSDDDALFHFCHLLCIFIIC